MNTKENRADKSHKFQTVLTILQSILICTLIAFVTLMMIHIHSLQGTAKVINYAGLVRGATQRLVKLEITGHPREELVSYLDDILSALKYSDDKYGLVSLNDSNYQRKLDELFVYWSHLKKQIEEVRNRNAEPESVQKLVDMSETYFELADATVFAAEDYSNKIAQRISVNERLSIVNMFLLILILLERSVLAVKMHKKNTILEAKAYIDTHTGLQNKNMCEELLSNKTPITESVACIMFDINNLKTTNDTLGHSAGDLLIADFARLLKSVTREKDFAGRFGGDEFILILYGVDENTISNVLERLRKEVEQFNSQSKNIPISYAQGWAISSNYKNCTYRTLFDKADQYMYTDKRRQKSAAQSKKNL